MVAFYIIVCVAVVAVSIYFLIREIRASKNGNAETSENEKGNIYVNVTSLTCL